MGYAGVKSLKGLSRQRSSATVVDGCRHHHGHCASQFVVQLQYGIERRLGVEGIKAGFQQQHVGTAGHQCLGLFVISLCHGLEIHLLEFRMIHVGCQREGL